MRDARNQPAEINARKSTLRVLFLLGPNRFPLDLVALLGPRREIVISTLFRAERKGRDRPGNSHFSTGGARDFDHEFFFALEPLDFFAAGFDSFFVSFFFDSLCFESLLALDDFEESSFARFW